MGFRSFVTDIHEVQRNLCELLAENTVEEEAASLEIAQSASRFSRRATKVVDDKLTFSATLMRAGEVSAATRLLAEVEEEVRNEEVALIETVNEVRVAQAVRRGRITRLRLARSLAVALLGACLLTFSAMGMAVAGAFQDREQVEKPDFARLRTGGASGAPEARRAQSSPQTKRLIRRLQIGDVKLVLTAGEYRRLSRLTGGNVDEAGLNHVIGLLTGTLAQKVQQAMAVASNAAGTATSTLGVDTVPALKKVNRAKRKAAKADAEQPPPEGNQQPPQDPPQEDEPEPEPSPSPSPSDGDGSEEKKKEEGGQIGGLPTDSL